MAVSIERVNETPDVSTIMEYYFKFNIAYICNETIHVQIINIIVTYFMSNLCDKFHRIPRKIYTDNQSAMYPLENTGG